MKRKPRTNDGATTSFGSQSMRGRAGEVLGV
jgi:hypothetical protein